MENAIGTLIVFGAIFILLIFILRWIGAWMLRIDEIIELQRQSAKILKEIRDELKKPNS